MTERFLVKQRREEFWPRCWPLQEGLAQIATSSFLGWQVVVIAQSAESMSRWRQQASEYLFRLETSSCTCRHWLRIKVESWIMCTVALVSTDTVGRRCRSSLPICLRGFCHHLSDKHCCQGENRLDYSSCTLWIFWVLTNFGPFSLSSRLPDSNRAENFSPGRNFVHVIAVFFSFNEASFRKLGWCFSLASRTEILARAETRYVIAPLLTWDVTSRYVNCRAVSVHLAMRLTCDA